MSQEAPKFKAPRALESIQGEYRQLCYQLGQLNYQLYTLGNEEKIINEQLRDLNLEAGAAVAADQEAKKKATEEAAKQAEAPKPEESKDAGSTEAKS